MGTNSGSGTPRDAEPIEREGSLHVKFTVLDGKVSNKFFIRVILEFKSMNLFSLYFFRTNFLISLMGLNDSPLLCEKSLPK